MFSDVLLTWDQFFYLFVFDHIIFCSENVRKPFVGSSTTLAEVAYLCSVEVIKQKCLIRAFSYSRTSLQTFRDEAKTQMRLENL